MKKIYFIFATTALLLSNFVFALQQADVEMEVEIKKVPLTWKQARYTDGEELFIALCAACHGKYGEADGPVAAVLKTKVPDLTILALANNGIFPVQQVEDSIVGKSKIISHGTIEMPIWGAAFEGVRPDWKGFRREAIARQRIHNLVEYIASIQIE